MTAWWGRCLAESGPKVALLRHRPEGPRTMCIDSLDKRKDTGVQT